MNLCFDQLFYDPDINWVEEDWAFVYSQKAKPGWPALKSYRDFKNQTGSFKKLCRREHLDPASHQYRVNLRLKPYPNCTNHTGTKDTPSWGEFSQVFPNTEYFRLADYLEDEKIPHKLWLTKDAPVGSFYAIGIDTFHLDFDYFSSISQTALTRVKKEEINILFFYHEGDHPLEIKKHLDALCQKHELNPNQIFFISGNNYADKIQNFYYLFDDEILYKKSISEEDVIPFHTDKRGKNFTALVRINKLWRSIFMSELWNRGFHTKGYFSYNQVLQEEKHEIITEPFDDQYVDEKMPVINAFLNNCPFKADALTDEEHNQFKTVVNKHFENSYCNFVVETYFSIGLNSESPTALSEKVIKPICHNQFFIIIGPPHSLKELKKLGYKTFDRLIDESYDEIVDPEERMNAVIDLCSKIAAMSLGEIHDLYVSLKAEITHNSKLFLSNTRNRLNDLIIKIQADNTLIDTK